MTKEELVQRIHALLQRAPAPARIETVNTARAFKRAVVEARKAKSPEKLTQALRQLEPYYQ